MNESNIPDSKAPELRLAGVVQESIVDGPGLRLVVFAQGCPHRCPGCHNPHTHSYEGGITVRMDAVIDAIFQNPLLDGVTISGGEPFLQAEGFAELAGRVKSMGLHVMTYTGYIYETIVAGLDRHNGWRSLLDNTDILVDGPFVIEQRSLSLRYRGSSNQRLIDVQESGRAGRTVYACMAPDG